MTAPRHAPLAQQKLWEAAMKGDSAMIRILAMSGADLELRNEDGMTPFALATQNNHADTAMTILAAREMQYLQRLGAEQLAMEPVTAAQKKTA